MSGMTKKLDEVHYPVLWGLLKINHDILGSRNFSHPVFHGSRPYPAIRRKVIRSSFSTLDAVTSSPPELFPKTNSKLVPENGCFEDKVSFWVFLSIFKRCELAVSFRVPGTFLEDRESQPEPLFATSQHPGARGVDPTYIAIHFQTFTTLFEGFPFDRHLFLEELTEPQ